jgi:toxin YhaV
MLHPLFLDQVEAVVADVERAKLRDAKTYKTKNCSKRLAAMLKLAFGDIPHDPAAAVYRQGNTLGSAYTHWRRAKFFQQYRLYFRYDLASKVIIYAWVNDEDTKRAYGSKTDAYAVFSGMLGKGHPPDSWVTLKVECEAEDARRAKAGEMSVADQISGVQGL